MKAPRKLKRTFNLVALDPGFAKLGWAVVHVHDTYEELHLIDVFETRKSSRKQHVLACEDNFERAREIAMFLDELLETWDPKVVCFEAQSHVRNSSAASKIALSYGALAAVLSSGRAVPAVSPTPQRIKKQLTGRVNATKDMVERKVCEYYSDRDSQLAIEAFKKKVPKSRREHGFDAAAVSIASFQSEIVRTARQFAA